MQIIKEKEQQYFIKFPRDKKKIERQRFLRYAQVFRAWLLWNNLFGSILTIFMYLMIYGHFPNASKQDIQNARGIKTLMTMTISTIHVHRRMNIKAKKHWD